MDNKIVQNITTERLKRASQGFAYEDQKNNDKKEDGLGGGFRYCELGVTLFDAGGQIHEEVKYNDLAQHVYSSKQACHCPQMLKSIFLCSVLPIALQSTCFTTVF